MESVTEIVENVVFYKIAIRHFKIFAKVCAIIRKNKDSPVKKVVHNLIQQMFVPFML